MGAANLPKDNLKPEAEKSFLQKNETVIAALIFLLALIVRIAYIVELHSTLFWDFLLVDAKSYHAYAIGGASTGTWLSPLYGWLLKFLYMLTGSDLWVPRLLQAVVGTGTVLLIYLAARRLGGVTAAVVAGIVAALYGPFVFYGAHLMKTTYATFFLLLGFLLLLAWYDRLEDEEKKSPALVLLCASGFSLGISALFRGNTLLLLPFIFAWVLIISLRKTKSVAVIVPLFLAAYTVSPAIVIGINSAKEGRPVGLTTSAGFNFFEGNSQYATGYHADIPGFPRTAEGEFDAAVWFVRIELHDWSTSELKVLKYYRIQALSWIASNPGAWLGLTFKKFYYFFNRLEIPDNYNYSFMCEHSVLLRLPFAGNWLIAPLALAGIIFLWPLKRKSEAGKKPASSGISLLLIFALGYMVAVILFYVTGRMRLPAAPFLIIISSLFIMRSVEAVRAKPKSAIIRAVILVVAAVFVLWPRPPVTLGYVREHYVVATHAVERAEKAESRLEQIAAYDLAVMQYEEALKYVDRGERITLHMNALQISRLVYKHEKTAKWKERIERHTRELNKSGSRF
jgi:4-amino-4-deoxy-L-arabinose transferase-like glycosyltransferase